MVAPKNGTAIFVVKFHGVDTSFETLEKQRAMVEHDLKALGYINPEVVTAGFERP